MSDLPPCSLGSFFHGTARLFPQHWRMTFRMHLTRRWLRELHTDLDRDEKRVHKTAGLRLTEGRILVLALERPGLIMTEAGYLAGVSRSQASRVARGLADRGLLSLRPTPSDRRVVRLFPTRVGGRTAERLTFLLEHRMYAVLMDLPEDELVRFGTTLLQLREGVKELDPARRRTGTGKWPSAKRGPRGAPVSGDTARGSAPPPSPRSRGSSPPTSARRRRGAERS